MRYAIALLFLSTFSLAQEKKINTLNVDVLYHAGINPAGELYTVSEKKISRFDKDGNMMKEIPLPSASLITQFDAWHLTQVVLYFREAQHIEIYNPDLEIRNTFVIDSVFAIEPQWIAASFDQKHFWIFDKADQSIKKVNYKTGEVVVDEVITALGNNEVRSMREYQRFLFVQTKTGLLIFNNIGKHIRTIPANAAQSFDFFGEEIALLQQNSVTLSSLFTKEERSKTLPDNFQHVWLSDDRLFGRKGNSIEIYSFDPQ
jgi:hypothetical protein